MKNKYKRSFLFLSFFLLAVSHTSTAGITATFTHTNCLCAGSCNGTTTVTPAGGTAPYTYAWSPSGGGSATATGLCAGLYTVQITDNTGLSASDTVRITSPAALNVTATGSTTACAVANGTATGIATGGTIPYTWSWSPTPGSGQGTATAGGLSAGTYSLTLTDKNLCTATTTAVVASPSPPTASLHTFRDVYCFGACTGAADVITTGGTAPYSYTWIPSGGTAAQANGLCAGTYTADVSDAHGCNSSVVVVITQNAVLAASSTTVSATCDTCLNGSATANATNGNPPYTYSWTPSGQTTQTATGLAVGTYSCCITDAAACQVCTYVSVTWSTGIEQEQNGIPFQIWPNPFGNTLTIETDLQAINAELFLYSVLGQEVMHQKINEPSLVIDTGNLSGGIYVMILRSDKGSSVRRVVRQ